MVLLNVASTCATPECTFLLPLALTIFGLSTSSVERETLSGAPAAGAGCSFFGFAVFFSAGRFGAAASAFGAACLVGGCFSPASPCVVGSSGFVGFVSSAM